MTVTKETKTYIFEYGIRIANNYNVLWFWRWTKFWHRENIFVIVDVKHDNEQYEENRIKIKKANVEISCFIIVRPINNNSYIKWKLSNIFETYILVVNQTKTLYTSKGIQTKSLSNNKIKIKI